MTEYYTFQQDSAPAHRSLETIALLASETPDFIFAIFMASEQFGSQSGGL